MQLELKNISHRYGKFIALNNINITLTPGVYALLGPNGAGKSTMMNIITNVIEPSEGEILFENTPIKKLGQQYRNILSYMPQQQGLYETFTASRFLAYISSLKDIPSKNLVSQIENVLRLVNLLDYKNKKISEMSGGMKQRLLLAQAIINNPKVLILDEPTAGLDPKERIRIRNIISQISKDKIVLFATHVVSDIEHLAKYVIFLKKGHILEKVQSPMDLCKSLFGYVYEIYISKEELDLIESKYLISNIYETQKGIKVRIITKDKPCVENYEKVFPTLEEAYLYYFEVENQ